MKYFFITIATLLLGTTKCNPQEQKNASQDLMGVFFKGLQKSDKIILHPQSIAIPVETIFTESLFESYTHPVPGVNAAKIKDLIIVLDYKYLKKQKTDIKTWDIKKYANSVKGYEKKRGNYKTFYAVAQPIYSEDEQFAFVYFKKYCAVDCGSVNLWIYKKINEKWILYEQLPISIS